MTERQLTFAPHGHILTNANVWSPDGQWIYYDTRTDVAGSVFDGQTIERVNVETGQVQVVYRASRGARVGVVTCSPVDDRIVFIHGPEEPTPDWSYNAFHRQGVILDASSLSRLIHLDARDLSPPFTPGALRGGTHLHVFSRDGQSVSFTYEDHVLAQLDGADGRLAQGGCAAGVVSFAEPQPNLRHDQNQRNVGVCTPLPVRVSRSHPRNHDGEYFSVLATRTVNEPQPGSDEISKAFEEAWVGVNGYLKPDGTRQRRALAFQGHVVTPRGDTISEVFIVDIPDDLTQPGDGPLQGTATRRPHPPAGTVQRRLTFTADRQFPGIQGPRHWLRSSPDGSRIAFLMKDDAGVVQLWTISPHGGEPAQLTRNPWPIASAFTWSPDGSSIACAGDNSVFIIDAENGQSRRITPRSDDATAPRPEACVFSPDGRTIAFVRTVASPQGRFNQVCVCDRL